MNKLVGLIIVVLVTSACNNPSSTRTEQMQDAEITSPPTGAPEQVNQTDTSANDVQDSSTTVGYDTSARRKN